MDKTDCEICTAQPFNREAWLEHCHEPTPLELATDHVMSLLRVLDRHPSWHPHADVQAIREARWWLQEQIGGAK
jgi:hypothetical protein